MLPQEMEWPSFLNMNVNIRMFIQRYLVKLKKDAQIGKQTKDYSTNGYMLLFQVNMNIKYQFLV